jgi:hypothetical protein
MVPFYIKVAIISSAQQASASAPAAGCLEIVALEMTLS